MSELTQRLVTRYAKFNALKNLLEKWLKAKRKEIVEALNAGEKCPDRGPYLLKVVPAEERLNWREEFKKHLMTVLAEELAEEQLVSIENRERGNGSRLMCVVNPQYGRRIDLRLPR